MIYEISLHRSPRTFTIAKQARVVLTRKQNFLAPREAGLYRKRCGRLGSFCAVAYGLSVQGGRHGID